MNLDDRIELKKSFLALYLGLAYLAGVILSWLGLLVIGIAVAIYFYQNKKDVNYGNTRDDSKSS